MVHKFVTKMRDKVKSMRKEDEGFSLVELIVVIVILAILIGVTIGGVYGYVNKARKNTDVNNAATIQGTLSTLAVNKDLYAWANGCDSDKSVTIKWTDAVTPIAEANVTDTGVTGFPKTTLVSELNRLLTDGLPAVKVADHFTITISSKSKQLVVTCRAYSSTDDTTALEGEDD